MFTLCLLLLFHQANRKITTIMPSFKIYNKTQQDITHHHLQQQKTGLHKRGNKAFARIRADYHNCSWLSKGGSIAIFRSARASRRYFPSISGLISLINVTQSS